MLAVNVCNGGGSIIPFPGSSLSGMAFEAELPHSADPKWLDYCRSREFAERSAAKKATSAAARRIHQDLAQAYALILRDAGR